MLLLMVSIGYFLLPYFNTNGRFFPMKNSVSKIHPDKLGHQIINFGNFIITMPDGWEDEGYRVGQHADLYGILKKDKKVIRYEYGLYITSPTETLQEFLFNARNNSLNMADSYKYAYPISSEISNTIRTGRLTDSILNLYPKIKTPEIFLDEPNYYSLTKYNDSVYFVPIEVPEIIANSKISNLDSLGYRYNFVLPKNNKSGYTKITVGKEGSFPVVLLGENVNLADQEVLIKAAKSLIIREFNTQYKQL